jgi:ABC-type nitrate/sulfonate/bicarbonate transport system substrate-binding protein
MRNIINLCNRAVCIALTLFFIFSPVGCQKSTREALEPLLELTLAIDPTLYTGLIAVADEKGFFKQEGVNVKMNLHPSGLDAMKGMIRGEAQVATVSDIAFAIHMNENPSLRIIASIGTSVGSQIVGRKDRNIHEPSDLIGKRIGYSPGTGSDYHFHAFLLTNHISINDITAVAIPPARQAEAVLTGEIDAVSAFDTYSFVVRKGLGDNAVAWDSQNRLAYQWLLTANESSTKSPEAIKRLLKALIRAEDFILTNKDETKAIISRKWNLSPEYISYGWSRSRLDVSLNQSIITSIQSYVKWDMVRKGKPANPPDVLQRLYTGALNEINPKLVTIFR